MSTGTAEQHAADLDHREGLTLADRYERRTGRVHLTGIQALARLPIDQCRRDKAAGRSVGTYISGYEGSPLAGYDLELIKQRDLLDEHDITFEPGLNEEAAATAVQGSQLIDSLPKRVDAVVGYWYGKAPGLDRASDALRHANLMGTHPAGGAVAFVGDDPGAKSSSVPCASERALADLGMPTFYPADAGEILEFGRHAVALSRASGLWTALKIVTAVADGSASVNLLADPSEPVMPRGAGRHEPTAMLLQPRIGPLERDFMTTRVRLVREYARLNGLNRVLFAHDHDRVGIMTAGKTSLDVREALTKLGLDEDGLERAGIRLLKLGLIWPLDADEIREFAAGLDEVIVIEEKRTFLESAVRDALYGTPDAPLVTGKTDVDGSELFAEYGELDVDAVALGLAVRLRDRDGVPTVRAWEARRHVASTRERLQLPLVQRAPYYCSGCPHNTSTRPHTDSVVGAGIGCHAMVMLMDADQVGDVVGLTQMGGEGSQWLGMAPFVKAEHFVQNLGDGTFHHSGSLAVRAAVASGRNITYRILYNSAVAMTGGQDAVGQMDVAHLVRSLQAEGVSRVIVTTDDVKALRRSGIPRGVRVWDRSRIAMAEQVLARTPGTTVLVHEQECATELRRKRKRGLAPQPTEAVVINERLCEGCGDCGQKSNCLSVHPIETEFGRKTMIHQSSCNSDVTCLSGDCPAFTTVKPGTTTRRRAVVEPLDADSFPAPEGSGTVTDQSVRLMGIGGTGVVTTSQVLATAAMLAGRHVRTLDQTGLAQKGGAVVSDVRMSARPLASGNRVGSGDCELYLGYDLLVAAEPRNLDVLSPTAMVVVSTSKVPTGAMVSDVSVTYPLVEDVLAPIVAEIGPDGQVVALDARHYAEALFGAEQFANMMLIGIAHQSGALHLSSGVIEEAIALNGVAVDSNVQAFRRGRQYVAARADLDAAVGATRPVRQPEAPSPSTVVAAEPGSELERLVAIRVGELRDYQDAAYANRYERLVERTRQAEVGLGRDDSALSESVAAYAFKLMAYKDEYEVARLARDTSFHDDVRMEFGTDAKMAWRLHPPTLRALGMRHKLSLGAWFTPAFMVLRVMRRLRGTWLDPFGYAEVRRVERRLVVQYERTVAACLAELSTANHGAAVELASLPDLVRGYEQVKLRSVVTYDTRRAELLRSIGLASIDANGARLNLPRLAH